MRESAHCERLFHCKSCGFVSTIRSEFGIKGGVIFCKDCLTLHRVKDEPEHTWVNDAINAHTIQRANTD